MTEKSASPVATAEEKVVAKTETTKKVGAPKAAAKPRVKPSHPSTADMVKSAIKTLAERGGSSLQAIKKYITATYKIDAEKQAPFIKKYLKAAVTTGTLVQTKGKGASGSFKLPVTKNDAPKSKPKAASEKKVKPKKPASPKKAVVKKTEAKTAVAKKPSPKKSPVKKATAAEKKAKSAAAPNVAKPKSPSKTKKAVKAPTAKPKAPKPKKAASPKAAKTAAAKKPTAQKK